MPCQAQGWLAAGPVGFLRLIPERAPEHLCPPYPRSAEANVFSAPQSGLTWMLSGPSPAVFIANSMATCTTRERDFTETWRPGNKGCGLSACSSRGFKPPVCVVVLTPLAVETCAAQQRTPLQGKKRPGPRSTYAFCIQERCPNSGKRKNSGKNCRLQ